MNEAQRQYNGCVMMFVAVIVVVLGVVFFGTMTMHYAADYVRINSTVQIARLQAQDHITVACMENSWFTSMAQCVRLGGVNGTGWAWWQWATCIGGIWVAILWVQKKIPI